MPQGVSYVHHANLYIRNIIPCGVAVPSPAALTNRGGAVRCYKSGLELRISSVLRSSLSEIARWIAAWQMPRPLCSCILALVANTGGADEFRPTLWEECASSVEEKANGPVDGIGVVQCV
jgi:hypothetical protein